MMPSGSRTTTQSTATNGTVTTTTVVTTSQNPSVAKFTQAELGSRSFARKIEKNIADMNERKSEAPREFRGSIEDGVIKHEDLLFGSTNNRDQLPERVVKILEAHGMSFYEGDRMVHIPGALYFSIAKATPEGKKYTTFALDEEPEPEPVSEPVATEPAEGTNTLGSVNTEPEMETGMMESPFAPVLQAAEKVIQEHREPVIQITTEPVVKPTAVETNQNPLATTKKLDDARTASSRERDAYYANKYINSTLGKLNDLLGNKKNLDQQLFKTINDYIAAKYEFLASERRDLPGAIAWEQREQFRLARLLSHDKYGTFVKLSKKFNLETPTLIETRASVAPIAALPQSLIIPKITIAGSAPDDLSWEYLFMQERPHHPALQHSGAAPAIVTIAQPAAKSPEQKINHKILYDKLFGILSRAYGIGQLTVQPAELNQVTAVAPLNKKTPESLFV